MAKKKRIQKKLPPKYGKTFIAEWITARGKNHQKVADAVGLSRVQVTRICNGERQYTQETLEAIADYLEVEPASLLMRDPSQPDNIWSLWEMASLGEKQDIVRLAEVVVQRGKKAG